MSLHAPIVTLVQGGPQAFIVDVVQSIDVSGTYAPNIVQIETGMVGPPGPQGPGTVESINGYTGPDVTLTAADVAALPINAAIEGGTY